MSVNATLATVAGFYGQAAELLDQGSAIGAQRMLDQAAGYAAMLPAGPDRKHWTVLVASRQAEAAKAVPIDHELWDSFVAEHTVTGGWSA